MTLFCSRSAYLTLMTIALLLLSGCTQAKHNVTIDTSNSSISYSGDWNEDSYDTGAKDHWTSDSKAKATFTFTGVAIYYQVHLYRKNFPAGALLSVDDKTPDEVVLFDPKADNDATNLTTVWSATNLQNGTHTLHVAYWDADLSDLVDDDNDDNEDEDDDDVTYITLDTLVFTVLDQEEAHSTTTSTSSTSSATSTPSSTPSSEPDQSRRNTAAHGLKYAGIAIGGLVALGFLATIIPILYRRNQANKAAHNFVPLKSTAASAENQQAQTRSYDYTSVSRSDTEANPFIAPGETAYTGTPAYSHDPQGATRYNP